MEEFFKLLRKIQKRERNNASLARVDSRFYKDMYTCIRELKEDIGMDPFSEKQELLRDVQRIATEICERREHKITEAALMNIHRSYHLFKKDRPQFDIIDTTPLNLTKEEEQLYFSLVDTLKNHRNDISLDKFSQDLDDGLDEEVTVERVKKPVKEPIKEPVKEEPKVEPVKEPVKEEPKVEPKSEPVKEEPKVEPKSETKIKSSDEFFKPDYINPDDQFVNLDENKPVKNKDDFTNVTILIFKNINPIIGVDEKIYGPFHPQDIVVLPKINADILLKYHKARLVKI